MKIRFYDVKLMTMKDGTKIPMDDVYSIESEIFKALD